jgi:hypothetical protein
MVKLVDQSFLCVDQLVDDLHEWRDLRGAGLMNLLKDLTVPEAILVASTTWSSRTSTQVLRFSKNRLV